MYELAKLMFLYTSSPLHFGAGVSLGAVDLPVQRERHTGYPMAQGSGLKGAIRHHLGFGAHREGDRTAQLNLVFGPENAGDQATSHAGAVAFGDGRLLLFPVRSLIGTFAYCTSVLALGRLLRDIALTGSTTQWQVPPEPPEDHAWIAKKGAVDREGVAVLEDFDVRVKEEPQVAKAAEWIAGSALSVGDGFTHFRERVKTHLVVLPDELFAHLTRLATVVEPHVRINDDTGAAEGQGFFYAEHLPPDAVLWSVMGVGRPRVRRNGGAGPDPDALGLGTAEAVAGWLAESLNGQVVQAGADATTGRGLVHVRVV